jgi:uncharacterized protein YlxW (UPF0749 family)
VLVPVTALLAGLLFATSAATAAGTDLRAGRRTQLTELIAEAQRTVDAQERQAAALRSQVARVQAAAAAGNSSVATERARGDALAPAAGLIAVTGPGLTVRLDDAPRKDGVPPASRNPDDLVVHQQDVQAVVNALWAGGAEAMTIMNERVLSTTAVRCVGNTLLLHGRVYSPPFVVTAIGDQTRMGNALDAAPDVTIYRQYVAAYKLVYGVTRQTSVTLPGVKAAPELAYAKAGAR